MPSRTQASILGEAPLLGKLRRMIAAAGPVTIAEYMHLCHADPQHGYYANSNPLGAQGDFITAPEISQMFGELIGAWLVQAWQALGEPDEVAIVELGPGRGTLMRDILRTIQTVPKLADAVTPVMVETSATLRKLQQETLAAYSNEISWVARVEDLPEMPSLIVGNEFLDALPFRQFIKQNGQWRENCVAIGDDDELQFATTPTGIDMTLLPKSHETESDGAVFESAPAREAVASQISAHLHRFTGAGLLIDYGHINSGFGDTFQAVRNHESVEALGTPGLCDLTSHVDFEAIAKTMRAENVTVFNPLTQGEFLLQSGLLERAGALGSDKSIEKQAEIRDAVERLASPDQMGDLFKVLAFASSSSELPPFTHSNQM